MIRICQRRDAVCPHGIDCPYWKDGPDCPNEPKVKAALPPDADVAGVVERLNGHPYDKNGNTDVLECLLRMSEAADLITRLSAELAEARAERDTQRECKDHARKCCDAAEAERDRLKEALKHVRKILDRAKEHYKGNVPEKIRREVNYVVGLALGEKADV